MDSVSIADSFKDARMTDVRGLDALSVKMVTTWMREDVMHVVMQFQAALSADHLTYVLSVPVSF